MIRVQQPWEMASPAINTFGMGLRVVPLPIFRKYFLLPYISINLLSDSKSVTKKKCEKKSEKNTSQWRIVRPDDPANFGANRTRIERDMLNSVSRAVASIASSARIDGIDRDFDRDFPFGILEACTFPFGKARLPCSHRRCTPSPRDWGLHTGAGALPLQR